MTARLDEWARTPNIECMIQPVHLTHRLFAVALGMLCGTAADTAHAQSPAPAWAIASNALVSIGDNGNDTLILRAGGAVRLSNGTIVVAFGRASQLQWFDAKGTFLRSVGRRGQGPNEFGRSIYVYSTAADTVVAHDATNRRYHYLTPDGRFVKLDTLGDARREAWMYDRTIIPRLPGGVDFARVRATLSRIPFNPRDSLRFALIDVLGNVWMHDSAQGPALTIYSPDGQRIGATVLPPRFRPFQILDTLVLGHWTDNADDTERIQLRRLTKAATPPRSTPPVARTGYDQETESREHYWDIARMMSSLRNLGTAQEAHFADYNGYASSVDALQRTGVFAPTPGVAYSLTMRNKNSYFVIARHPATKIICVLTPGADLPTWVTCG